ncbi:hypothetical protein [Hahella chejuensis]|uniref:hypothetical protein n=1 Tax=Hahella chejuensis TaxID=158327 RepID=UPI0011D11D77|nr:hypothetical protein [Hahella chejuensis]
MDDNIFSLHVSGDNKGDLSESVGNRLNLEMGRNYKLTAGVDSRFIEIPCGELNEALKELDV